MKKAFWFWALGPFFEIIREGKHPLLTLRSLLLSLFLPFSLPLIFPGMCSVLNVQSYLGGKRKKR